MRAAILFSMAAMLAFGATQPAADLKTVAAEPNAARRARAALVCAEQAASKAGENCRSGEYDKCNALLDEVRDAVDLAEKSLQQTGVDPSRNPRHYKDAEIRTRKLVRELEAIRAYVHPDDLDHFETIYRRISETDDGLLSAIMGQKKKSGGGRSKKDAALSPEKKEK